MGTLGGSQVTVPPLEHLRRLLGSHGLFEHAEFRQPRVEHGYTTDDNGRALVVAACRAGADDIFQAALDFVIGGFTPTGWHNRMNAAGAWTDAIGSEDSHGRAVWGLGATAGSGLLDDCAGARAVMAQWHLRPLRSPRAVWYAVLGGVAAMRGPAPRAGEAIVASFRAPGLRAGAWPWPEDRLAYDNARLPEAMLAVGEARGDEDLVARGLALLDWLAATEEIDGMFAFTPVGGRGPDSPRRPAFDQQPLEAWAMADACERAFGITGDSVWMERLTMAVEWFWGRNHVGVMMIDPVDGAGYDGLEAGGVNQNAGAESTLAVHGAHLALARVAGT